MNKEEQYNLALEIVKLQDELKEGKKNNKHAKLKYNLKKIGAISKAGAVFSAIPLAGTLITCASGWNPFKLNDQEVPALITTTIDKEGNETEEKKYEKGYDTINMYYYTAWEKTDNNNYSREVYTYNLISDTDIDSLIELMNPKQEITQERIEELLTKKIADHKDGRRYYYIQEEYIPTVKEEELKRGGYIELQIIKQDKSDIKIQKESKGKHIAMEILKLLIEGLLVLIELGLIYGKTYFFESILEDLKEDPEHIDIKSLELQLKAKQLLFETIPYQSLHQQQIIEQPEPQKVLKKEPERMQQQGQ